MPKRRPAARALPLAIFMAGALGLAAEPEKGPPAESPQTVRDLHFLRQASVLELEQIPGIQAHARRLLLELDGRRARAAFRFHRIIQRNARLQSGTSMAYFRDDGLLECAAYELTRLLGMSLIPPTVERTVNGTRGSVQLWVEKAITEQERRQQALEPPDPVSWQRQHESMRLFDSLIANRDRNLGNRLIDRSWRLWLIDHTQSFGIEGEASNLSRIHRLDRDLWQRLQTMEEATVRQRLSPYLNPRELEALSSRRLHLISHLQSLIETQGLENVIVDEP